MYLGWAFALFNKTTRNISNQQLNEITRNVSSSDMVLGKLHHYFFLRISPRNSPAWKKTKKTLWKNYHWYKQLRLRNWWKDPLKKLFTVFLYLDRWVFHTNYVLGCVFCAFFLKFYYLPKKKKEEKLMKRSSYRFRDIYLNPVITHKQHWYLMPITQHLIKERKVSRNWHIITLYIYHT